MNKEPALAFSEHPAIHHALVLFPRDSAIRAAASIDRMLSERIATDGVRGWSRSVLTGDGFPVEFTFTTGDDRLRYTVEPASSRIPPQHRLDKAIRLINGWVQTGISQTTATALRNMQRHNTLRYGAWLGGRHGPDHDDYKIYAETPAAVQAQNDIENDLFALPKPRLPDRNADLRMIAYSPATQQWEVYFRVASMQPHHVSRILAPCGLGGKAQELLDYIVSAYGYQLTGRLPGPSVGVSYSLGPSEKVQSVTLFFFARVLWGADARIRKKFGSLSRKQGWDDHRYQQLTTRLDQRADWKTHHGIFGINLTRNGKWSLSIGIRPPGVTP